MANKEIGSLIVSMKGNSDSLLKNINAVIKNLNSMKASITKSMEPSTKALTKMNNAVLKTKILEQNANKAVLNAQKANYQMQITKKRLDKISDSQKRLNGQTKLYTDFWASLWKIGKLAFVFRLLKRMGNQIGNIINIASDFNESLNKFQSATQEYYTDAIVFARNLAKSFGLAETTIMDYQSTFMNMLNALDGISSKTANELSKNLTLMALDYASLFNTSVEGAMTAFQSMLAGRTMSLRTVSGIDVTDNTLYQYYEKIIDNVNKKANEFGEALVDKKTLNGLTQIEKRLLRIYAVYDQMDKSKAIKDYVDTINTFSQQSRIFTEQLKELGTWFGNISIGLLKNIMPVVNASIMTLTEIFKSIAYMVGYKAESPKDALNIIGSEAESANEEVSNLVSTLGLLSFDKFEVLKSASSQGNSDTTASIITEALNKQMEDLQNALNEIPLKAREISDEFLNWLGYSKDIEEEIEKIDIGGGITADIIIATREVFKLREEYTNLEKIMNLIATTTIVLLLPKIISLGKAMLTLFTNTQSTLTVLNLLNKVAIFGLIYSLMTLTTQWDDLDNKQKSVYISLVGIFTAITIFTNKKTLATLYAQISKLKIGIKEFSVSLGIALAGITLLSLTIANWDSMNGIQKTISILGALTATVLGLAMAFGVLNSTMTMGFAAAGIIAGATAVIATISSAQSKAKSFKNIDAYANGGFPEKGQMFIARESGPELVGNIGGSTAVANNNQIIEGIKQASYQGMKEALQESNNNVSMQLVVDGSKVDNSAFVRAIMPALKIEERRIGGR